MLIAVAVGGVFAASCGNTGERETRQVIQPNDGAAPCPATLDDVLGRFSLECVKGLATVHVVVPDLTPQYVHTAFALSKDNQGTIGVLYASHDGKESLRLDISDRSSIGGIWDPEILEVEGIKAFAPPAGQGAAKAYWGIEAGRGFEIFVLSTPRKSDEELRQLLERLIPQTTS